MTTILLAVGLTKFDAGDLGDRVPFIGRLQRTGRRRLLLDRPRREFRIDTGRTQKYESIDAGGVGGMNDVRFDRHIVVKEFRGEGVVGVNAADLGGGEHDGVGPILLEPSFDQSLIARIDDRSILFNYLVSPALKKTSNRRSDHPLAPHETSNVKHLLAVIQVPAIFARYLAPPF